MKKGLKRIIRRLPNAYERRLEAHALMKKGLKPASSARWAKPAKLEAHALMKKGLKRTRR